MSRLLTWLAALLLCLSMLAQADEVAVPALQARVTDLTSSLNAEQLGALEQKLKGEFQHTGGRY